MRCEFIDLEKVCSPVRYSCHIMRSQKAVRERERGRSEKMTFIYIWIEDCVLIGFSIYLKWLALFDRKLKTLSVQQLFIYYVYFECCVEFMPLCGLCVITKLYTLIFFAANDYIYSVERLWNRIKFSNLGLNYKH